MLIDYWGWWFLHNLLIFGALKNDMSMCGLFLFFVWFIVILKISVLDCSSVFDGLFAWYSRCTVRWFWLISFDFLSLIVTGLKFLILWLPFLCQQIVLQGLSFCVLFLEDVRLVLCCRIQGWLDSGFARTIGVVHHKCSLMMLAGCDKNGVQYRWGLFSF